MHLMTKTTFGVKTDPKTGLKFIRKLEDEMTKNHRETDKEESSGIMPEVKGILLTVYYAYMYIRNILSPGKYM